MSDIQSIYKKNDQATYSRNNLNNGGDVPSLGLLDRKYESYE